MHLNHVRILSEKFPTREFYPFHLDILQMTERITFSSPVTFFIGENGTGKTTLLKALSRKCNIHIWEYGTRTGLEENPYEQELYRALEVEWVNGPVPGSFFSSETFRDFSKLLDEWARGGAGILEDFGGKSLMNQSHGQSILSFCRGRYRVKGLYFLDEPETALSPKSQMELLKLVAEMSRKGHAQFLISTHSPILLACPGATIYSFDSIPVQAVPYEETEYFRFYREFLNHPDTYLESISKKSSTK